MNLKKLDEKDFVVINRPLTAKEEQAMKEFIAKNRKKNLALKKKLLKAESSK